MTRRPLRWSDNDRYFGRFTYAHEPRSRKFAVVLKSGDDDDYPGCGLRICIGAHTLIAALPAILRPARQWREFTTEPTRSKCIAEGRPTGFWEKFERMFGFTAHDGALHLYFGAQTHEWPGCKSKCIFYPWRERKLLRHTIYDVDGRFFADLPNWNAGGAPNGWKVRQALEAACPKARFEFADFDGERIVATCTLEEREYRRGKGIFRLLFLGRNDVSRDLDLSFSAEVGKRKGSWKGGAVGHSCAFGPSDTPESAFRRYCAKEGLTFIGAAPAAEAVPA